MKKRALMLVVMANGKLSIFSPVYQIRPESYETITIGPCTFKMKADEGNL
jgi:hypothetical protein